MNKDTTSSAKRVAADCRKMGGTCTLLIEGSEEEVMRAAITHAVDAHGEEDTPSFREQLRGMLAPVVP